MCFRLLIVEDDDYTIQLYRDAIKEFNEISTTHIECVIERDDKGTKEKLLSTDFDGAIIDLKLSQSNSEYQGIGIINEIINKQRFPIYVVSGNIAQITDMDENVFFQKRDRANADFQKIFNEIINLYNTGITKILGNKGYIEDRLNTIFWTHLSKSMRALINDTNRLPKEKEKILLRYTILHMQEYIDQSLERYHPIEFYIVKPIKTEISTGDIVTYNDERYLVLTPACDIIKRADKRRNADRILFCKIKKLMEVEPKFNSLKPNTSKNNSDRKKLHLYMENKKQYYHFIPKSSPIEEGLVDFQDTLTLKSKKVDTFIHDKTMIRIATVSMPFLKDIISRYSNYLSRQGSPELDTDEIYTSIFPQDN